MEGVIPTCTSPENPARYEPISCGDVSNSQSRTEGIAHPVYSGVSLGSSSNLTERRRCWQSKLVPQALLLSRDHPYSSPNNHLPTTTLARPIANTYIEFVSCFHAPPRALHVFQQLVSISKFSLPSSEASSTLTLRSILSSDSNFSRLFSTPPRPVSISVSPTSAAFCFFFQ